MELRATAHHLGSIVAAGGHGSGSDDSSSDSGMGNLTGYGIHGVAGRGGGGGGAWGEGESDDGEWGVEYAWSAQGGAGRYQAPTLVNRMPQAICNNYLRVRREKCGCSCVEGARGRALLQGVLVSSFAVWLAELCMWCSLACPRSCLLSFLLWRVHGFGVSAQAYSTTWCRRRVCVVPPLAVCTSRWLACNRMLLRDIQTAATPSSVLCARRVPGVRTSRARR